MKWITFIFLACCAATLSKADPIEKDRFWILWEKYNFSGSNCPDGKECQRNRRFSSRLFEPNNDTDIFRLFGMLDASAFAQGRHVQHPEAPRICQHYDAEVRLGFNPEPMPLSDKLDALRGLEGLYFDVSRLAAPDGFKGDFGKSLQQMFTAKFEAADIPILTEDEVLKTPGQPKLAVYFSRANKDTGCTYSVFASLSQTALLTRNLNTKLRVGVWSFSARPSAEFPDRDEHAAILSVADAFVRDFQIANE